MSTENAKYQPLYLKHRPQTLGELVGQKSVVQTLTNAIEHKRIAHAYLFTGPRGTGKTSSARILAKSLNCDNGPTVSPCLTCASCVSIKDSSCPSVFEIDAASNNSVDDARTLIERAPLAAQGGKNKLYIIDECHMLTKEAFNALLKTIEEPPPNVIFILATTEEHKVPPTIVSRCQRLMFRLVNHGDLAEHLAAVAKKENIEIERDAIDLIARRAAGGLRDALGLLDQAGLLSRPGAPVTQKDLLILLGALDEDVLLNLSKAVLDRDGKAAIDQVAELIMQGREPFLIAQELAKHFLNLTKASYVSSEGQKNPTDLSQFILGSQSYIQGLIAQSKAFERVELSQMVEQLDGLEQTLKRTSQPSLSLEMALLSLCHRHDIASLKELSQRLSQIEQALGDGTVPQPMKHAATGRETHGQPRETQPLARETQPPAKDAALSQRETQSSLAPASQRETQPSLAPQSQRETQPAPAAQASPSIPQPAAQAQPIEESEAAPVQNSYEAAERSQEPAKASETDSDDELPVMADDDAYEAADMDEDVSEAAAAPPAHQAPPADTSSAEQSQPKDDLKDRHAAPHTDLEELWSDLLDALHKRSIPAYSLVSMHAFPLRFEAGTLTIGVNKEFFQKPIENKAGSITQAYKDIKNQDIRVFVKVVGDEAQGSEKPKGQAALSSRSAERTSESVSEQAPRPQIQAAEPSLSVDRAYRASAAPTIEQPKPANGGFERSVLKNGEKNGSASAKAPAEPAQRPSASAANAESGRQVSPTPADPSDSIDSSLIQEAYKLFEGPGSRLIG